MAGFGTPLAVVVFVPGTFVAASYANFDTQFTNLLSKIRIVRKEVNGKSADVRCVTTQLDAASQLDDIFPC